jgi:peptide/nickel transport system ATP-binding protein
MATSESSSSLSSAVPAAVSSAVPSAQGNATRAILTLEQLVVHYPGSAVATLNGLDLVLHPGERLALVGPSGCGKSTVARAVLQLLPPGSRCDGGLDLAGQDPRRLSQRALRRLRGGAVGLVFQDPMTRLNPLMTIGEHLADTLVAHQLQSASLSNRGVASPKRPNPGPLSQAPRPTPPFSPPSTHPSERQTPSSPGWPWPAWPLGQGRAIRQRAEALLARVGIGADRYDSYPHEFSGGMRQRLAIALAMALQPPLVIADEPTTSLDVAVAGQVMAELTALCQEAGSALLLISHDLALAGRWCDRIAVLDQGRLVEQAPAQHLLTAPRSALAQRLVAAARAREGQASPAPSQAPLLLEIDQLRCWHPLASLPWQQRWLKAVDGVSLQLHQGETVGLVGASGCGKSTLCRALIGLAPVRGGAVRLLGVDLLSLGGRPLRRARRRIQMVFQDPLACLNPLMAVGEAIADPLLIHGLASRPAARARARELLAAVGLNPPEAFERRLPRQLSGGQQQRVAIARALVLDPQVLLCDESVSMLDAEVQAEVLALLRELQNRLGLGLIFVTHDLGVASGFCQRVIVLEGGRIVEEGPGDQLLADPQAAITRSLVAACPRLPSLVP